MTPRSVQIWFQNRRQRLLKPSLRGEGGEGAGGEELGDIDDAEVLDAANALPRIPSQAPVLMGRGMSAAVSALVVRLD